MCPDKFLLTFLQMLNYLWKFGVSLSNFFIAINAEFFILSEFCETRESRKFYNFMPEAASSKTHKAFPYAYASKNPDDKAKKFWDQGNASLLLIVNHHLQKIRIFVEY